MKSLKDIKNIREKIIATLVFCAYISVLWIFQAPCPIKYLTGIPCPGCQITRGVLAALRLDFVAAFNYHPMFWAVPLLYVFFIFDGYLFKSKKLNTFTLCFIAAGFLINWVYRLILTFAP